MIDRRSDDRARRRRAAPLLVAIGLIVVACASGPTASSAVSSVRVSGHVLAGPTCPVERNPPDPACAPRPVADATVQIIDTTTGATVAEAVTDGDGAYTVDVPPGSYRLGGASGLPGISPPEPVPFVAVEGVPVTVDLEVDTGIR